MLLELNIRNYALIEDLKMDFSNGFTVITGETGAGKSILLGALSLILGERADFKVLRDPSKKCIVEGTFDLSNYQLKSFFIDHDLDYEDQTIVRREIIPSGKSRAFINDTPVTLADLKPLLDRLIDLHTQHATLTVAKKQFQIKTLDSQANTLKLCAEYNRQYYAYQNLLKQKEDHEKQLHEANQQSDYITFQLEELNKAQLTEGELDELENEWNKLSHSEDLKSNLYKAHEILSAQDPSALDLINQALDAYMEAAEIDDNMGEDAQRLNSLKIELADLSQNLESIKDDIVFDPQRLEIVQDRLNLLNRLLKKHNVNSVKELIDIQYQMTQQVSGTEFIEEEIERLTKEIESHKQQLFDLAEDLNHKRRASTSDLISGITTNLQQLGMPDAQFDIEWSAGTEPAKDAIQHIKFLFSANRGSNPQPLENVASGGEVSRIVLSLKSLIARASQLPTIIFDEIDTGVSGEVADKTGELLRGISNGTQVIAITHLPQMAGKGQDHLRVYKETHHDSVTTHIVRLNESDRVEEIAKMLSGSSLTKEAVNNAKVLLKN